MHERGRVGHGAHQPFVAAEPAREVHQPDSRRDRDHEAAAQVRGDGKGRGAHLLRLHGEDDGVGVRELGTGLLRDANAELLCHARARLRIHVHREDLVGARSLCDEAADDGARHVAAADEGDAH